MQTRRRVLSVNAVAKRPAPIKEPAPVRPGSAGGMRLGRLPLWALPVAGIVIGAWAITPPYIGPRLAVPARAEIADHVIPGIVIIAVSFVLLATGRRVGRATAAINGFLAGLLFLLAGLWMTATHVPLIAQVHRGQASVAAAINHMTPGLVVLILGGLWVAQNWSERDPGG